MEELKQLVLMLKDTPTFVLWVLIGYLFYKLAIIGSIYGTIRFVVEKIHDGIKHRNDLKAKPVEVLYKWKEGVEPINEEVKDRIVNSLLRLKRHLSLSTYDYVHGSDAGVLEKLVNDYISNTPVKK